MLERKHKERNEPLLSADDVELLFTEFELIHLVYHRSANQHRAATWWKSFNILHRKLRQLLLMLIDMEQINASGKKHELTSISWNKLGRTRHRTKELNNECAARLTARYRYNVLKLSKYIVKEAIPKCYLMCYTILQTGQFITLGFALLALVSRVFFILRKMKGLKTKTNDTLEIKDKITKHVLEQTGKRKMNIINEGEKEDVGVAIIPDSLPVIQQRAKQVEAQVDDIMVATRVDNRDSKIVKKKNEKKKKKRKSVKAAMDDIFGF